MNPLVKKNGKLGKAVVSLLFPAAYFSKANVMTLNRKIFKHN